MASKPLTLGVQASPPANRRYAYIEWPSGSVWRCNAPTTMLTLLAWAVQPAVLGTAPSIFA